MKRFLLKVGTFIGILLLLTLAYFTIVESWVRNNANFKLESNINSVVLGHSQPECAYNDKLISNFKNFGNSGESYFYNFQKLKPLIKQNPGLKVVFIEFEPNNCDLRSDKSSWSDKSLSKYFPLYDPFIDNKEKLFLARKNPKEIFNALAISINHQTRRLLNQDLNFTKDIGAYLPLKVNKVDSLIKNKVTSYPIIKNTSEFNLEYLRKMVNYCHSNDVQVFFVRSPITKYYLNQESERRFKAIKNELFSDVSLIDLKDFPLQNKYFADYNHLNYEGAKLFSIWFDALLKQGLLNQPDMQNFIDNSIVEEGNR